MAAEGFRTFDVTHTSAVSCRQSLMLFQSKCILQLLGGLSGPQQVQLTCVKNNCKWKQEPHRSRPFACFSDLVGETLILEIKHDHDGSIPVAGIEVWN